MPFFAPANRYWTGSRPAFCLGLTGGVGSGKSTAARMLAAHGAAVVDADAISRQLTAPGGAALPAIAAQFGPQFIAADGALDRAAMRELIHGDPAARQRLEAILHPLVQQTMQTQAQEAARQGARCIVFDVPLLVENLAYWRPRIDALLVVDCPEEVQIARVMARNQLTRAQVMRILASQTSRARRLAVAEAVIDNGGTTPENMRKQIETLLPRFGI